ncbi:PRC-barrel domain containing protein [Salinirubellus salinus]|jgi:sporulation protein YlmC with PRC-barrel domain|uniref:PRC-barrel domain containing protein n=1 Tax=Salinirubellus salinus TaxID=1364945 RepID=A0A9E7U731_9EURY|nr:PRC-barrel domain containing protein [Salinirubellus salinus]UWM53101.1 PRC-barrel domain containing protein [Salinirubellus salinus]
MKITADEQGKRVVNKDGETVGMVTNVDETAGKAYIDSDPNIAEKIMSRLGWDAMDADDYAIEQHQVDSITDDEIRLKY